MDCLASHCLHFYICIINYKLFIHELEIPDTFRSVKEEVNAYMHDILLTENMKIVSPEGDMQLTAQLGEDCVIPITVEGSPLPKCQWFHNGARLRGQTQFSLNIKDFR